MNEVFAAVYAAGFFYSCGWFVEGRGWKWLYLLSSLACLLAAIAFELRRPVA